MKTTIKLLNLLLALSLSAFQIQSSEQQIEHVDEMSKKTFSIDVSQVLQYKKSLIFLGLITALTTLARAKVPFLTGDQRESMLNTLKQQKEDNISSGDTDIFINCDNKLKTPIYEIGYNLDHSYHTLELHGFGDHPDNHKHDSFKNNYDYENQTTSFYNAKKRTLVCYEEAEKNRFFHTSMGSARDIDVTIIGFNNIVKNDPYCEKIIVQAISRGCNPAIEALAEIKKHQHDGISRLGVSAENCQRIISLVEDGGMILTVPMKSRAGVLKHLFGYFGPVLDKILLPWATLRCKPWDRQSIDRITELQGLKIRTAIFYAQNDQVVGNELDERFTHEFNSAFGEDYIQSYTIDNIRYNDKHNEIHQTGSYIHKKQEFLAQITQ